MPHSSDRLSNLPPYIFAVLGQRIQTMMSQGIDVISLDIGSPDLPPPQPVIDTLAHSAQMATNHGYSGYRGSPGFRQAVSRYYGQRFDVDIDSERQVLPLIGSKEGIINLCFAYLDRGDTALVPDIAYPSYSIGARLAGADICWLPLHEYNDYQISIPSLPDAVHNAKLLWVNYPNNPTGATTSLDFFEQLLEYCKAHDILLVSDNPYVDVTYDGYVAPSILQIPGAIDCTVEFMSCSKTYNMGGWRLGAAVGNEIALKKLLQVKSNVDSGHFRPIYDAGTVALNETPREWIENRNRVYARRRNLIMEALPAIGLEARKPKGSLYIWAKVSQGNGATYVEEALQGASVAFAPGAAYGRGGEEFIRISLGISDDRLQTAIDRLKQWYLSK